MDGIERYVTDIIVENMRMLGGDKRFIHNNFVSIEIDRRKTLDFNGSAPTKN